METPKLKRFMGKPTDYSPKARMMNLLGWYVAVPCAWPLRAPD